MVAARKRRTATGGRTSSRWLLREQFTLEALSAGSGFAKVPSQVKTSNIAYVQQRRRTGDARVKHYAVDYGEGLQKFLLARNKPHGNDSLNAIVSRVYDMLMAYMRELEKGDDKVPNYPRGDETENVT